MSAGPPLQGVDALLQLTDRGIELYNGKVYHHYLSRRRQLCQNLAPPLSKLGQDILSNLNFLKTCKAYLLIFIIVFCKDWMA